ncbi:sushi, von Willebrand factor type A, EGF and pentraxin domain-containing protein 1-like isoform X2 [Prorops nasuta]|uniref:sushi, von Willebrand factor type A, EGF and pentraxin domain-containing protein 1-like isoform X2 n=1 Tax=Prorops nasuta TaxID=863751 RepID=UPI0034CEFF37
MRGAVLAVICRDCTRTMYRSLFFLGVVGLFLHHPCFGGFPADRSFGEETPRNKIDFLSSILKSQVDRLRSRTELVELVFLVDASDSIGKDNFRSELDFVRKLLADFTVKPSATRVALVAFAGKKNINRVVDQISRPGRNDEKCFLLNVQLKNVGYSGGGTYTKGALLEALAILENSRKTAKKVIFLITDGFSNGGDPGPTARLLKTLGTRIFTFGIRTGNVERLRDIASEPSHEHSYLLDNFSEFEALARRALHRDLTAGEYVSVATSTDCNILCSENSSSSNETCCDTLASCTCGTATGHYACRCSPGYFGSGLRGFCQVCPNGTYASEDTGGDAGSTCRPCPDVNHVTLQVPATSEDDCVCASGFSEDDGRRCQAVNCPRLTVPTNGYFANASACSNVQNSACRVRCKIGFQLIGDSVRYCRKNGSWSGKEAQCLLKTCPVLRAPSHGKIRCWHETENKNDVDRATNRTSHPIDTRCEFRCETGFQLHGSKVRNCLPQSRWDGQKVSCRAVKCDPLKEIPNGKILPRNCLGSEKLPFATNCTVVCNQGFDLEGPRTRLCGGRTGVWSRRRKSTRCVDRTPPVIKCPGDVVVENLKGANFALLNWTVPMVSDNADESPTVWSKPYVIFPWKKKIGAKTVTYVAEDSSGNKARCKFKVNVIDKEPPMVENCIHPPAFFTDAQSGVENISWDEPVFHDNSKIPTKISQSHFVASNKFPIGTTKIFYNATDRYGNFATCILNITVKDICKNLPTPANGQIKCELDDDKKEQCVLSCNEGFEFPIQVPNFETTDDDLLLRCNAVNRSWADYYFPDCAAVVPKTISQNGSFFLDNDEKTDCRNSTTLQELSHHINEELKSKLFEICDNNVDCNLIIFDPICESSDRVSNNLIRKKRQFRENNNNNKTKREIIEIKFKFSGKISEKNLNNPEEGLKRLHEKIESLTKAEKLDPLSKKIKEENSKFVLNLHLRFSDPEILCNDGSVLKKTSCVKCPIGTFYNNSTKQCQSCPFGQYQNITGSLHCERCPYNTFTKQTYAKSIEDCTKMCLPGFYSRRGRYQNEFFSLEPCSICEIGAYQPNYGEHSCLPCPRNTTTKSHGSTSIRDCINIERENICDGSPCINGGSCVQEDDHFSCECRNNYIGSRCEIFQSPCQASPCLNGGTCYMSYDLLGSLTYKCNCRKGYMGENCERSLDECTGNPCQNNGRCNSTDDDYFCECDYGYEGQFCEIKLDHCDHSPCTEGSICRIINETYDCSCKAGFLGRHCNLLPCDWLPCHENAICVNLAEINATRNSYRCECPSGYTGSDCATKINFCHSESCENNGTCLSGITNYTCVCSVPFTGIQCETELSSDYVMHFSKSGITDYVMMKGPSRNISEISVCLWLQSLDVFNYGTILSYATEFSDNAFTITDYNGFVVYVNGDKVVTDIKVNDGYWHFLCVTWESSDGNWSIFIDGHLKDNGSFLSKGIDIQSNGFFVIGQEQDRVGGGFSESESFLGKLSLLDIWSTVLSEVDVAKLLNTCDRYHGDLFAWSQMQEFMHGDIVILKSPFCRGCALPVIPFKGSLKLNNDSSEGTYICDEGYFVKYGKGKHKLLKRKCLKHGQWEGNFTPYCEKIRCGYPGYFPRGRMLGKSYNFGDEIQYSCFKGYKLRGNPRRLCNSSGLWTGSPPTCIGITCNNLLAPDNGNMNYMLEEYERDDVSILQEGQQLDFKCNAGYRLKGHKRLTCLENGTWDHERPECISSGCPPPKEVEHGYIASVTSETIDHSLAFELKINVEEDEKEKFYFYGDIVGFSCLQGYKFRANHNLMTEFRLQCSNDGTWAGFVPDCVLLYCPWPNPVRNGTIFLKLEDNTTIEVPLGDNMVTYELELEESDNSAEKETRKFLKELFVPGAHITTVCNQGFRLIGDEYRTCTGNETWSSESPNCQIRECQEHSLLKLLNFTVNKKQQKGESLVGNYGNLTYSIQGNVYGSKIIFTCLHDMRISLSPISTELLSNLTWMCNENGTWHILHLNVDTTDIERLLFNSNRDACINLKCPSPNVSEFGNIAVIDDREEIEIMQKKEYTFGDIIYYRCMPGYRIFGQVYTTCLSGGKWSKMHGRCVKISCGKPQVVPGVTIKGQSYFYQETLTYICPNEKIKGTITCKADGLWSEPPDCNIK